MPVCVPPPVLATGQQPFAVQGHIPLLQPSFPVPRPIPVPGSNGYYPKLHWVFAITWLFLSTVLVSLSVWATSVLLFFHWGYCFSNYITKIFVPSLPPFPSFAFSLISWNVYFLLEETYITRPDLKVRFNLYLWNWGKFLPVESWFCYFMYAYSSWIEFTVSKIVQYKHFEHYSPTWFFIWHLDCGHQVLYFYLFIFNDLYTMHHSYDI